MKLHISITAFLFLLFSSSYAQSTTAVISTNLGDIEIMLYDNTPNHRDAFIKLANQGHYDGTLFYRVVKDFVVQGGSSDSRNAPAGKQIGYGDSKLTIDSEFVKGRIHKKGAICAPRQPEDINHFKMSDISQFYIVEGRKYTDKELDLIEDATNIPIKNKLYKRYYVPMKDSLASLKTTNPQKFNELLRSIKDDISFNYEIANTIEFSDEEREIYTTIGGIPTLDGDYTVFGEVIKGLDIVDKIAKLPTDKNNRPYTDVKMSVRINQ